jgi:hypothetical protein
VAFGIILALLPALSALPLVAAEPPKPATVALKFAWPARLRCEVEHATRATFSDGGPLAGNTVHLSLEAVRGGGGWLVRQTVKGTTQDPPSHPEYDKLAHDLAAKSGKAPPERKKMDPHELQVLLYPPFTVTSEGGFGGLELNEADRAILDKRMARQRQMAEMIKKLAPNTPATPAEDALETATKKASSTWNVLVGAWAGKHLREGEIPELRIEHDQAVPFSGTLHLVDRMALTRGVPCKPAPRGGCVRLEVTTDPAVAAPAAGAPEAAAPTSPVPFHTTATVVTDPRTLIPRSYTRVMNMATGGQPGASKVVETMTFRCR